MPGKNSESRSMASQFRRDYLLVSIIPLLLLFLLVILGTIATRDYLAELKQAQAALERSEAHFKDLYEASTRAQEGLGEPTHSNANEMSRGLIRMIV